MDEALFSMPSAPNSGGTMGLSNSFLSNGLVNTAHHCGSYSIPEHVMGFFGGQISCAEDSVFPC
jgi:hypothetical protein